MALIHAIIDDLVAQLSHTPSQGRELARSIIQYLDGDAGWTELYSATGELLVPSTLEIPEGIRKLFSTLQQVPYVVLTRLAPIHFCFCFLETGVQQTAIGVAMPVEGNQDPSGYSTDECQSEIIITNVFTRRSIPDHRCGSDHTPLQLTWKS